MPVAVDQSGALAGKTITAMSVGNAHSLALCSDGSLAAWGEGNYGELGTGTTARSLVPVEVSRAALPAGARFVAITAGHTTDLSLGLVALPPAHPTPAASRYAGSVQPGPDSYPVLGTEGLLTATVMANSTFSARLLMDGRTFAITGAFDRDGVAHFGKTRATSLVLEPETSTSDMVITLHRDTDQQLSGAVTRTIQSNLESTSAIAAGRLFADGGTFDASVPPEYLGKGGAPGVFSIVMPVSQQLYVSLGTNEFPQGTGFGTLTIAKTGLATFTGTLADGTTVTAATTQPWLPPCLPPLRPALQQGRLLQRQHAADPRTRQRPERSQPRCERGGPEFAGGRHPPHWVRPAMSSQYYPKGWPTAIITQLLGAKYTTTPGQSSLKAVGGGSYSANGYVYADLGLAPLAQILGYTPSVYVSPADMASPLWQSDGFSLNIDRPTGRFSGTFRDGNGAATAYQGILYQKGALAGGHGFYLTAPPKVIDGLSQSGVVDITAQGP